MTDTEMLTALKISLKIVTGAYDGRLVQLLETAKAFITREGATLNTTGSIEDANLVIMYASYLWNKRDSGEGMPRMLRWALNNRIFSEKMRAAT